MNQYTVDNIKSTYFGITCYELEHYKAAPIKGVGAETHTEIWVKVVFDYPCNGSFREVQTWFKASELTLV